MQQTTKRMMQNVHFNSVDEFYSYLPVNEAEIVNKLRDIVMECLPDCTVKLSYNVPYFFGNKAICFIWPPAVQWGNGKQKGVRLGFTSAWLLNDEYGYLERGGRKQIFWKEITNPGEIDEEIITGLLIQAWMIDQEAGALRRGSKRK